MRNRIIGLLILSVLSAIPLFIQAQGVSIDNPLGDNNMALWQLIDKIVDTIFYFSIPVVTIMILVSAFFFITAMGEPEKILKAKKMLLWVLIGFIVILMAKGIIAAVGEIFGLNTPYNL